MKRVPINTRGYQDEKHGFGTTFIEPGDDQDECLALPLYVTRQTQSRLMLEFERFVPGTLTNIAVLKHRS